MSSSELWLLIIPAILLWVINSFMINWEIGLASGSLPTTVFFFVEASKPNASPFYLVLGIVFAATFIWSGGHSFCHIRKESSFKTRIADYIANGQIIHNNQGLDTVFKTNDEYVNAVVNWSNEVADYIRKNKSDAEATLFLDDGYALHEFSLINGAPESTKRLYAARIVNHLIDRLKELQKRL